VTDLATLFARRASAIRELADLEVQLGLALAEATSPPNPDQVLNLREAAIYLGEPVETFRRRHEFGKVLVSRANERRLRYSRQELDRIKKDRLAVSGSPVAGR
jgi:hypothetical protein